MRVEVFFPAARDCVVRLNLTAEFHSGVPFWLLEGEASCKHITHGIRNAFELLRLGKNPDGVL